MTSPDAHLPRHDDAPLAAGEGVNQGSASSTQESQGDGSAQVLGEPGTHAADSESAPAPPDDMESGTSREARDAAGPGQQLQAGEG